MGQPGISFLISGADEETIRRHTRDFEKYFGYHQILRTVADLSEAVRIIDSLCSDCSCVCMFLDLRSERECNGKAVLDFFKKMSAELKEQGITFKLFLFANPDPSLEVGEEEIHFVALTQLEIKDYWQVLRDAICQNRRA